MSQNIKTSMRTVIVLTFLTLLSLLSLMIGQDVGLQPRFVSQDSRIRNVTEPQLLAFTANDGLESGDILRIDGEPHFFKLEASTTPGDGGISKTVNVDGSQVFRAVRQYDGPIHVDWYGAITDDGLDDSAAIQDAVNATEALTSFVPSTESVSVVAIYRGRKLRFGSGTYHLSSPITFSGNYVDIDGSGTFIRPTPGYSGGYAVDVENPRYVTIQSLSFVGFDEALDLTGANISLARTRLHDVHLSSDNVTDTFAVRYSSVSSSLSISECSWQGYAKGLLIDGCDLAKMKDCRFRPEQFDAQVDRDTYEGVVQLVSGRLRVKDCMFNTSLTPPAGQSTASGSPVGWFLVGDGSATEQGTCELMVEGSRFGAEGGGLPTVIWNVARVTDAAARTPTVCRLRDNILSHSVSVGLPTPANASVLSRPAVLAVQIPNICQIVGNQFTQTPAVAVDYPANAVAPIPWSSASGTPREFEISGNTGSSSYGFRNDANFYPKDWWKSSGPNLPMGANDGWYLLNITSVNAATSVAIDGNYTNRLSVTGTTPISTISGGFTGQIIVVTLPAGAQMINSTAIDGIELDGGANVTAKSRGCDVMLFKNSLRWIEIARANRGV